MTLSNRRIALRKRLIVIAVFAAFIAFAACLLSSSAEACGDPTRTPTEPCDPPCEWRWEWIQRHCGGYWHKFCWCPTPTATPIPPTETPIPPTDTPTATSTVTPTPKDTSTPTIPPTITPSSIPTLPPDTPTPPNTPTRPPNTPTPVPPTNTPKPTDTSTPTPWPTWTPTPQCIIVSDVVTVTEVITLPCPGTLIQTQWISECPDHTKLVEKIDALTILVEQVHFEQIEVADRLLELEVIVSDYGMTERVDCDSCDRLLVLMIAAGFCIGSAAGFGTSWVGKRMFTTNIGGEP